MHVKDLIKRERKRKITLTFLSLTPSFFIKDKNTSAKTVLLNESYLLGSEWNFLSKTNLVATY